MLHEVGRRLQTAVRPADTVARFGGDEFAVLLDGVDGSAEAADAAARILRRSSSPFEIDGKKVYPRASVGICLAGDGPDSPEAEELLRNADVAMYMAKRDSKGSYRRLRAEDARARRRAARAPVRPPAGARARTSSSCTTSRSSGSTARPIFGVEALLRWQHPTQGLIPPLSSSRSPRRRA